jgi:TPR repeat protein
VAVHAEVDRLAGGSAERSLPDRCGGARAAGKRSLRSFAWSPASGADAYVLPCCWLGGHVHGAGGAGRKQFLAMLEQLGGTERIDARRRSIRAIVEDEFFQRSLPESWGRPSCAAGKPITCARVCGQEFDRRTAQNSTKRRPEKPPPEQAERLDAPPSRALEPASPSRRAARLKLAEGYRDGRGVEQNYQLALRWYQSLLKDEASPALLYQVGELYRTGGPGLPKDEAVAIRWYREAAHQGSPWAQYRLGEAYRTGRGVEQDAGEAARLYEMAARSGNHWAQYWLSESFRTGQGKPPDPAAAEAWLRRSAEGGNVRAMLTLGDLLVNGAVIALDSGEAAKWYRCAARNGNPKARR